MKRDEVKGMWLGLLGVAIFAFTLPMTRLAVGTAEAPQMSGVFVALARAALAALLSIAFLVLTRAPWPKRDDWLPIGLTSGGVVLGFPLLTSIAMQQVQAVHASVILGLLPLATAAAGAWLHRQRPSLGFWCCAVIGTLFVVVFAVLRSGRSTLGVNSADLLLAGAMVCAAVGYGWGGLLSQRMRPEHVICWALLLALPLTVPAAFFTRPSSPVSAQSWWALGYVAVFSMLLGFFVWYRALALGGTVRVSQVQLIQPFLSMLFAVPVLGERLDAVTVGFATAVIGIVFAGKNMPVEERLPFEALPHRSGRQ